MTTISGHTGSFFIYEDPIQLEGHPGRVDDPFATELEIQVVGYRRRGWGKILPWSWFSASQYDSYRVQWKNSPSGPYGFMFVDFVSPQPGVLSDPILARILIGDNGEEIDEAAAGSAAGNAAIEYSRRKRLGKLAGQEPEIEK